MVISNDDYPSLKFTKGKPDVLETFCCQNCKMSVSLDGN